MTSRTAVSPLARLSVTLVRAGLAVGLSLTAALLVISGSVETALAGVVPCVALGLACAYVVDTGLRWGRWLDDVTRDRPDTPIEFTGRSRPNPTARHPRGRGGPGLGAPRRRPRRGGEPCRPRT